MSAPTVTTKDLAESGIKTSGNFADGRRHGTKPRRVVGELVAG